MINTGNKWQHEGVVVEQPHQGLSQKLPKIKTIIVGVMILSIGYYMLSDNTATVTVENVGVNTEADADIAATVAAIGKHMVLPEGEEPILAEVKDAESLKAQQAFFTGAVNGDKLIIFPSQMRAILYSPARDRIINSGPIEQAATQ